MNPDIPQGSPDELGVVHWMNRGGRPRRAALLLAASLPLLVTGLLIGGDHGLRSTAILAYPACLIVAGLLLDRRTLTMLTVETLACVALVLGAESLGLVGSRPPDGSYLEDFIAATVILVITAIGVGLVAGQMRRALARAQKSAAALAAANATLEEQSARLHQARKMELVGRLAGGVAHDFNNLLSGMTGHLTLLRRNIPPDERTDRWLKEVDTAAWRAAGITRQLLSFAQQPDVDLETLDARELIETLRPRLVEVVGEDVQLSVRLPDQPLPVRVDPAQIERALLNLATNGRDAMASKGTLTLEARETTKLEQQARAGETSGRHVSVLVSDTGCGMRSEVKDRLFEPFFTTKLPGSTTGLGLAVVYTVVEQHGGWIAVESEVNHGSTFALHLPWATATDASVPAAPGARDAPG